jgi:hypothetical protein
MVIGWSMAAVQDATLVSNAFKMALARRCPQTGLVVHSDRGNTYTSNSYLTLLQQNNIQVSMSRTANCYDNAVTVSFFHSLKGECLDQESFQTRTQARQSTFDYIETFYNRIRRHSTLHYLSPVEFEDRWDAPRILPLYETGGRSDRWMMLAGAFVTTQLFLVARTWKGWRSHLEWLPGGEPYEIKGLLRLSMPAEGGGRRDRVALRERRTRHPGGKMIQSFIEQCQYL